jgi:hypothetical protein
MFWMARAVAAAFAVLSIVVWFYVLDQWWGLIAAIVLCLPFGIAFSLLPPLLAGTLRPTLGDVATTWGLMLVGVVVGLLGLAFLEDTPRVLVGLCGAGLFAGGLQLFFQRLAAMLRYTGETPSSG